jgi:hypothetical protein
LRVVRFSFIDARGVGHIFACTVSDVGSVRPPPIRRFMARCASGDFWSSRAIGVPQKPESFALVWCANGGRGEQTPFRIEPEDGKIGEDTIEPSGSNNVGDVLQQHKSRSHVADDPPSVGPEMPLVLKSISSSGAAERLAWETGSDEIHSATPLATVEGGEVRPDRSPIHCLVAHPRHESGRGVGVPLNVTYGSGVDAGESQGELEAPVTGAEVQGM